MPKLLPYRQLANCPWRADSTALRETANMRSMPNQTIRFFSASCLLAALFWLGGCATPAPGTLGRDEHASTRQRIVSTAERLVGTPYRLGGESPSGVDCSGLVQYTYRQAGIAVPRSAAAQFQAGQPQRQVLPGDLLFFRTSASRQVSHVGIYAGDGQMIHASSSSHRVRKVSLRQAYWRRHLVGGATFLGGPKPAVTRQWPTAEIPQG